MTDINETFGTQFDDIIKLNYSTTGTVSTTSGSAKSRKLAKRTLDDTLYDDYVNFAYAGDGNDVVYGSGNKDAIDGGNGDDRIYGGANDDLLVGGNGKDTVYGGSGNDMIGATCATGATSDNGGDLLVGDGYDSELDDNLNATGNALTSQTTSYGEDTIAGGNAKDEIWGDNKGNDTDGIKDWLYGGNADDNIHGGGGDDQIEGEQGADQLWGGAGDDTFGYNSVAESNSSAYDTIWDFDSFIDVDPWGYGNDRDQIDVTEIESALGIDFKWLGKQGGGLLGGTAGEYGAWYTQFGGDPTTNADDFTFVYADTDKDGDADLVIRLKGLHDMVAGDLGGVNKAPTSTDDSLTINEDQTVILSAGDFGVFNDVDPGDSLQGVRITTLPLPGKGALEYLDGATWKAVSVDQDISKAEIDAGHLRYTPTLNENGTAYAVIGFKVSDGTDLSIDAYDLTLDVTAVNDAPENTVPGPQEVNEDTSLAITGVSVSDVDAGTGDVKVTLSALHGDLTLSTVTGLTFLDAQGDHQMVFTGKLSDVNTALATLSYKGDANFNGSDTLTILTNDQGNTGADPGLTGDGSSEQDSDDIAITVKAVNDAPDLAAIPSAGYIDTAVNDTFADVAGTLVTTDPDVGDTKTYSITGQGASAEVGFDKQASSLYGTLYLNSGTGAYKFVANDAAIEGLNTGQNPTVTFDLTVTDGGGLSDTETLTINITGATEAPTNTPPVPNPDTWVLSDATTVPAATITAAWFTKNDTDADGNPLYITNVTGLAALGLTAHYDLSGHLIDITGLTLGAGSFSLGYTLSDGIASVTTGTVSVTVLDTTNSGTDDFTLTGNDFSYVDAQSGADKLTGQAILTGNAGIDTFIGSAGNDTLSGGAGNDTLFGSGNNDVLNGQDGDDYLDGGNNIDSVNGGAGNDILVWDKDDTLLDGGTGTDTLRVSGNLDLTAVADAQIDNIDRIDITNYGADVTNETLTLSATDVLDHLESDSATLFVLGDAGDTVDLAGATWTSGVSGIAGFNLWTNAGASVYVDTDVTVIP